MATLRHRQYVSYYHPVTLERNPPFCLKRAAEEPSQAGVPPKTTAFLGEIFRKVSTMFVYYLDVFTAYYRNYRIVFL